MVAPLPTIAEIAHPPLVGTNPVAISCTFNQLNWRLRYPAMTDPATRHPDLSADPARIHSSALVIDTHADTPQRFVDEAWDFTGPLAGGMLNLETAHTGNLAAEFFAIWPEPEAWRGRFAHRTLALIEGVLEQVRRHSAQLALCTSPADILAARAAGKFAVLMGVEGGHAIENSLDLLRRLPRAGRALYDAHLGQLQRLGRIVRRSPSARRPYDPSAVKSSPR